MTSLTLHFFRNIQETYLFGFSKCQVSLLTCKLYYESKFVSKIFSLNTIINRADIQSLTSSREANM